MGGAALFVSVVFWVFASVVFLAFASVVFLVFGLSLVALRIGPSTSTAICLAAGIAPLGRDVARSKRVSFAEETWTQIVESESETGRITIVKSAESADALLFIWYSPNRASTSSWRTWASSPVAGCNFKWTVGADNAVNKNERISILVEFRLV